MSKSKPHPIAEHRYPDESNDPEPPGLLDRFDPRAFVGIAAMSMGVVLIAGFLSFYFFTRQQSGALVAVTETPAPSLTPSPTSGVVATGTSPFVALPSPTLDLTATHIAATVASLPELRFAALSEIAGVVRIKTEATEWIQVERDLTILPGTTVLTDESSSVKITLSEGSVIRLSSQTQFTLVDLSGTPANPFTKLKLDFGKLWAIVAGPLYGQFEVQMPVGVAAVRGSFVSAEHNTTDKVEIVTCLEGHCRYENQNGGVDLATGQQTESINGSAPSAPHRMDRNQFDDWNKQKIPEVTTLTPTPTPSHTPTLTFTPSLTYTPSLTFTPSPTVPTNTPTSTLTPTRTPTSTFTATFTATNTPTSTATRTPGPAAQLAFIVQPPASASAGAPFTVRVAVQDSFGATVPYASATISLAIGSNPGGGTLGGPASVGTVNGIADFPNLTIDRTGDGYTLVASAPGLTGATSAAFNVTPGAAASFVVTGIPATVTAGDASSVTVTARDAAGNVATGYTGTIAFTSNDPQSTAGNGLPANYTFTPADAGVRVFANVILKTAGSRSVTVTDTSNGSITGTQSGITVVSGPVDHFGVTGVTSPVRVGTPSPITITAQDFHNNTVASYTGEIDFVLSDGLAPDPLNYTFTGAESGTVTLPGWITFQTPNTTPGHTVNVLQVVNPPFIFGSQSGIVVCAATGPCP